MKKIIVVLAMVLTLALVACGKVENQVYSNAVKDGKLVIGLDATFAPMGFKNNDNEIVGFDIDLAKEVGKYLSLEVVFQPINWDTKEFELKSNQIDMIWNGLTITDARKENILFSKAYMNNSQIIITNNKDIKLIDDLKGLKVGVQVNSSAESSIKSNDIMNQIELLRFDDYATGLLELESNLIDALVIDSIVGNYMITTRNLTNLYIAEENFGNEQYGIGFNIGESTLKEKIDEALAYLLSSKKAEEISIKWFGTNLFILED